MMKAEEILGVLIRAIGFWQIAEGLGALPAIGSGLPVVLLIAVKFVVGAIFIFHADGLVRAAYKTASRAFEP